MMLVSVVIPTKNRCNLLRETLASLQAQTHSTWEALVVDDGSSDGTAQMIQDIAAADPRIRLLLREHPRGGAPACRNMGIAAAQGSYLIFLDSDDLLAPSCLTRRVQVMEENPATDFAVFLTQVFSRVPGDAFYLWNRFTEEPDVDRFLRHDQPWQTSGPIWRKASLARVGQWNEQALSAQDWEFHLRALAQGLTYLKLDEVDSYWRTSSPGSISNLWLTSRHCCNRVRLFGKTAELLKSNQLWNERRRRIMAALYYEHAFVLQHRRRHLTLKIWLAGRRTGVVNPVECVAVLANEWLLRTIRRLHGFILRQLFPERLEPRTHNRASSP